MTACRLFLCTMALVATAGCHPADPDRSLAVDSTASGVYTEREPDGMPKRYSVVAYGYNYTDTYIDSFEVNGAGGGNLEVSIPTAGGGGHTCCVTIFSGTPIGTTFQIKWTRDRMRWCEQTVKLTKPVPPEPRYFEVHFYEDGHIEVEATQQASAPRLALERFSRGQRHESDNVDHDEQFSRCTNGRN